MGFDIVLLLIVDREGFMTGRFEIKGFRKTGCVGAATDLGILDAAVSSVLCGMFVDAGTGSECFAGNFAPAGAFEFVGSSNTS